MDTISLTMMADAIKHVAIRRNRPCMFWGLFGIGKSEGALQAVREAGAVDCDIRLGQYDSVDMRGIPGADKTGTETNWLRPGTFPFVGSKRFAHVPDDQIIVLILDEINAANEAVSAVAYQLIQERRVGEHILRPNVRIIAMGNPEDNRGVTNPQPLPLSNRFTHYMVEPNVNVTCRHFQKIGIAPIYIAFLQWRKPLIHTFDVNNPEACGKAVATPRTHEAAAHIYVDEEMGEQLKRSTMAGTIGAGPNAEFWGFVKVWDQVQRIMPAILKDPKGAELPTKLDMRYAVTVSISGDMDPENVGKYDIYLRRLDPDFTVLAWQLAMLRDPDLHGTPAFLKFAQDFRAVFKP